MCVAAAMVAAPAAASAKVSKLKGAVKGDSNSKVAMKVTVGKLEVAQDFGPPITVKAPLEVKKFTVKKVDATCSDGTTVEHNDSIPGPEFLLTNQSFGIADPRLFVAGIPGEAFYAAGAIYNKGRKVKEADLELNFPSGAAFCNAQGEFKAKAKKRK